MPTWRMEEIVDAAIRAGQLTGDRRVAVVLVAGAELERGLEIVATGLTGQRIVAVAELPGERGVLVGGVVGLKGLGGVAVANLKGGLAVVAADLADL